MSWTNQRASQSFPGGCWAEPLVLSYAGAWGSARPELQAVVRELEGKLVKAGLQPREKG